MTSTDWQRDPAHGSTTFDFSTKMEGSQVKGKNEGEKMTSNRRDEPKKNSVFVQTVHAEFVCGWKAKPQRKSCTKICMYVLTRPYGGLEWGMSKLTMHGGCMKNKEELSFWAGASKNAWQPQRKCCSVVSFGQHHSCSVDNISTHYC